ncbi:MULTISPECIES: hypothetical protein [unclassified Comamonas]|uniref:hypothetical protein n=1 Tax=unclassified Comamonas TaxID=2638500 RepID=UPI00289A6B04|nr:hypothetical protein [Comamonas sp.]
MTDAELITFHGGPAKLALKLGWSEGRAVQRIHNWRTRGIPAAVKLQYPKLFLSKRVRAAKPEQANNEACHA